MIKKLGIMQPYFFPYLGYFSLIKNTDLFILLDEVQFIRHGWIERNRILKQTGGWQYIKVPLKRHSQKTLIKEIEIENSLPWKKKILDQLGHYKKAPFYKEVKLLLEKCFEKEIPDIVHLNKICMEEVCRYLQIDASIKIFSEMGLKIKPVKAADEWALNICTQIKGVQEYWNPIGGIDLFRVQRYKEEGIELKFHQIEIVPYLQKEESFQPCLSMIDVMMFNEREKILEMLEGYLLHEKDCDLP
ncbi:MAG: WbqC family protein [Acetivibrio ethanolgignens]